MRKGSEKFDPSNRNKDCCGRIRRLPQDAKGLITKFMAYLEREGYSAGIGYPDTLRHLVKDGANLLDPENVKTVIAQQKMERQREDAGNLRLRRLLQNARHQLEHANIPPRRNNTLHP